MFVVVGYSAACLLLPCIVLCESLSQKLVILFSDVLLSVGNVILYPLAVHIHGDENSVVVFDYPLVYPKGNGERLADYLTHSMIPPSFVAAIYLCGAAIFWCLILGLFFRLQSIRLYSIDILLRPAALCFTIRH